MVEILIQRLGAAGAALLLEDGALILEHDGELDADTLAELRQHKPALLLRLQAEQAAHLHLFVAEARRFVGGESCDLAQLHSVYLAQTQATYAGDVLRVAGVGLDAFTEALQAAAPPALEASAALPADEEQIGERASILEHDGLMSRACADAWARELRHLEEHGRKVARAPVACRLAVGVSFVDASYPAGVEVLVLPAGAPLDSITTEDAEWLEGRLRRLQRLRREVHHGAEPEDRARAKAQIEAEGRFVLALVGGRVRLVERSALALAGDAAQLEGAAA